jgi:hypothetical protein
MSKGIVNGALLFVAADVDVVVVRRAIRQPVDQPRVGIEGEEAMRALGEEFVEVRVAQPARVLGVGLQLHEIDGVDHPDLQLGQISRIKAHQQQRCTHFRSRIARNINHGATGDSANLTSAVSPTGVTRAAFTSPGRTCRGWSYEERLDL